MATFRTKKIPGRNTVTLIANKNDNAKVECVCLCCDRKFLGLSKTNRICGDCSRIGDRGVHIYRHLLHG